MWRVIALRPIPLSLHGAFELLLGVLALLAPFALGLPVAAGVASITVGVCAIGLALDATAPRVVAAHQGFDYGLAFGALLAGLVLAVAGIGQAALLLGAIGLAQLALNAATRYSARA